MPSLVQDAGPGDAATTPVLLLRAWGESRKSFDRLMTCCRVYAPDLWAQGEADKPLNGYSLAEQTEDAAAILDALEVPRAAVVGPSSGGYVAQQLAAAHPERIVLGKRTVDHRTRTAKAAVVCRRTGLGSLP